MTSTDKDRFQKEKAIRYCLANGFIPYLEVKVGNIKELSTAQTDLTDIDVLGIEVERHGRVRRVIFDCKTLKTSPINRAFWAAGLMKYISSNEAFVILTQKATHAHQISADAIGVHLFSEDLFDGFAKASSIEYLNKASYASNINNWHQYYTYFGTHKQFQELGNYINCQVPLANEYSKALRGVIAKMKLVKGEINPSKNQHMSIYASAVLSLCYILSPLASQLSKVSDPSGTKENFEEILRYYIWEGKDNYALRKGIHELATAKSEQDPGEFELANWQEFVELVRLILDAPTHISLCCIPLREISLRYLCDVNELADQVIAQRITASSRVRQFIFRASSYLVTAVGLPKDCDLSLREVINEIAN